MCGACQPFDVLVADRGPNDVELYSRVRHELGDELCHHLLAEAGQLGDDRLVEDWLVAGGSVLWHARRRVILVGDVETIRNAVRRPPQASRRATWLREAMEAAIAGHERAVAA